MERNDTVIYRGRRYVIDGFDPMSVEPRRVYLRDPKNGDEQTCLYEELLAEVRAIRHPRTRRDDRS